MSPVTTRAARVQRFRALADESRLRILELLAGGEHCVCELTEALDRKQSLLSFHLKILKDAGLVTDRREGRWTYYALVPDTIRKLGIGVHRLVSARAARPRRRGRCAD